MHTMAISVAGIIDVSVCFEDLVVRFHFISSRLAQNTSNINEIGCWCSKRKLLLLMMMMMNAIAPRGGGDSNANDVNKYISDTICCCRWCASSIPLFSYPFLAAIRFRSDCSFVDCEHRKNTRERCRGSQSLHGVILTVTPLLGHWNLYNFVNFKLKKEKRLFFFSFLWYSLCGLIKYF